MARLNLSDDFITDSSSTAVLRHGSLSDSSDEAASPAVSLVRAQLFSRALSTSDPYAGGDSRDTTWDDETGCGPDLDALLPDTSAVSAGDTDIDTEFGSWCEDTDTSVGVAVPAQRIGAGTGAGAGTGGAAVVGVGAGAGAGTAAGAGNGAGAAAAAGVAASAPAVRRLAGSASALPPPTAAAAGPEASDAGISVPGLATAAPSRAGTAARSSDVAEPTPPRIARTQPPADMLTALETHPVVRCLVERRKVGPKPGGLASLIRSVWMPLAAVFACGQLRLFAPSDESGREVGPPIALATVQTIRCISTKAGKVQFELAVSDGGTEIVTHSFRAPDGALYEALRAFTLAVEAQLAHFAHANGVTIWASGWILCMHVARALKRYKQQVAGARGRDLISVPWLRWYIVLTDSSLRFYPLVPHTRAALVSAGTAYALFGTAIQPLDESKAMGEQHAFGFFACNGTVLCMRAPDQDGQLRWCSAIRAAITAAVHSKLASPRGRITFACTVHWQAAPAADAVGRSASAPVALAGTGAGATSDGATSSRSPPTQGLMSASGSSTSFSGLAATGPSASPAPSAPAGGASTATYPMAVHATSSTEPSPSAGLGTSTSTSARASAGFNSDRATEPVAAMLAFTVDGVWVVRYEQARLLEELLSSHALGPLLAQPSTSVSMIEAAVAAHGVSGLVFFYRYSHLRVVRVVNETSLSLDFGRFSPALAVIDVQRPMASVKFLISDLVRLCRAPSAAQPKR